MLRIQAFNPEPSTKPNLGVLLRFRDTGNWFDPDSGLEVPAESPPAPLLMEDAGNPHGAERWADVPTDVPPFRGQMRMLLAYYHFLKEDGSALGTAIDYQTIFLWDGKEVSSMTPWQKVSF